MIASNATPDKNHLSTGTLSFSDLKNEAEYRAKDTGTSSQIKPTLVQIKKKDPEGNKIESLKVVQALHSTPSIPTVVQGSADSTTKSAVAAGTIDIRDNPAQDISALSRDTANSLNELGKIFDKAKIEEQQEPATVFGEEAFRLVHNLKDDGNGCKIAIHIAIDGIMCAITGSGFASGAVGAGLNEALIRNLKGLDPDTAQIVSGIIGAAAAKAIGGSAAAGASAAAAGTKWNKYEKLPEIIDQLSALNKSEDYKKLGDGEYFIRYAMVDGKKVAVAIDKNGQVSDLEVIRDGGIDRMTLRGNPLTKKGNVYVIDKMDHYGTSNAQKTGEQAEFKWGDFDGHITSPLTFSDGFQKALADNSVEMVDDLYDMASHPVTTITDIATAIGEILADPTQASDTAKEKLNAYLEKVKDTAANGTSYERGELAGDFVFNLALMIGGGSVVIRGGAKGLRVLSKMGALTRVTTRTAKIADRTVTIGGDVWKKGSFKRGDMIDDALGNNLGHSFAKIDKLENGVAVSIKSIKLSDKTYETAKGIYNKLRRDVDALDDFTIGTRKGIDVTLEDYSSKKLEIAIPDMKITAEQQRGLEMVKEYAKEKGIEITITVVK